MLTDTLHIYHTNTSPSSLSPSSAPSIPTTDPDPLTDTLSSLFRDSTECQHGSSGAHILYDSVFGPITLSLAAPEAEESRKLFAHYLWNAELYVAERLSAAERSPNSVNSVPLPATRVIRTEQPVINAEELGSRDAENARWSVKGQTVLELGAGLGLSSIISALAGAIEVVVSDYPEDAVLSNIRVNLDRNLKDPEKRRPSVQGHIWGCLDDDFVHANAGRFTRIIIADCLWMPEQHRNLARSITHFLARRRDAHAYVVAGFHSGRDLMAPFFDVAVAEGLQVEQLYEEDVDRERRPWQRDRGHENVFERKRWLAVAVLQHRENT